MAPWLTARNLPAADFPLKPITIINIFAAGGSFDLMVRMVEPAFTRGLGQPIRQEFVPGASGVLGMTRLINAPADGHMLGIDAITNFTISTYLTKPKAYTVESFSYLGTFMVEPVAILVRKESPLGSIDDLMKAAQKRDGRGPSIGVTQPKGFYHLVAAIFREQAGGDMRIVNYAGGGPARNALIAGEVDCSVTGLFSAAPFYDQVRGLMVFADANPIPQIMKMPTVREALGAGKMPEVLHPTTLMIPAAVKEKYPDRHKLLEVKFNDSLRAPETRELAKKMDFPDASLVHWSAQQCEKYAGEFQKTVRHYERLLEK